MPLKIALTPAPEVFDPHAAFKSPYQRRLLQLFRAGATLYVWRLSSPHNWYLETGGREYMISGDRETCEGLGTGSAQTAALMRLAKHSFAATAQVSGGSRYENGLPEKEGWVYDAELAGKVEAAWDTLQAELSARVASVLQPNFQPDKLSDLAIALLRTLKASWNGFPQCQELVGAYGELDSQGLLELLPNGRFRLVSSLSKMKVPRGLSLQGA